MDKRQYSSRPGQSQRMKLSTRMHGHIVWSSIHTRPCRCCVCLPLALRYRCLSHRHVFKQTDDANNHRHYKARILYSIPYRLWYTCRCYNKVHQLLSAGVPASSSFSWSDNVRGLRRGHNAGTISSHLVSALDKVRSCMFAFKTVAV